MGAVCCSSGTVFQQQEERPPENPSQILQQNVNLNYNNIDQNTTPYYEDQQSINNNDNTQQHLNSQVIQEVTTNQQQEPIQEYVIKEIRYEDGNYKGQSMDGMRHGFGQMNWINDEQKGDKYIGNWQNDKRNGQGVYYWANGSKYVGEWKNDNKHGNGIIYWVNGDYYIGKFIDDLRTDGDYYGPNGYQFVTDNNDNGQTYPTLEQLIQITESQVLNQKDGIGEFNLQNGDRFIGELKTFNQFYGKGTYILSNGTRKELEWIFAENQNIQQTIID